MNITDYTETNLHSFSEVPFNEMDALVFSVLSYVKWPKDIIDVSGWIGIRLADLYQAEHFHDMFYGTVMEEDTFPLFRIATASPRFRSCRLKGYVSHLDLVEEKQFSAITFEYQKDAHFIAYRGTDTTIIGWKEDFNMSFSCPVPAQKEAVKYTEWIGGNTSGTLQLGGHSKGGNLAVYSCVHCMDIQERITQVYSFDGPGFLPEFQHGDAFVKMKHLFCKIVPQSSVIGMLMEEDRNYKVVKSKGFGFFQHNAFTWILDENGFCYLDELTIGAVAFDRTLNEWLKAITKEERNRFVDTIYSLTENLKGVDLADISENGKHNYPQIMNNIKKLDKESVKFILRIIGDLAKYPFLNLSDYVKLFTGKDPD